MVEEDIRVEKWRDLFMERIIQQLRCAQSEILHHRIAFPFWSWAARGRQALAARDLRTPSDLWHVCCSGLCGTEHASNSLDPSASKAGDMGQEWNLKSVSTTAKPEPRLRDEWRVLMMIKQTWESSRKRCIFNSGCYSTNSKKWGKAVHQYRPNHHAVKTIQKHNSLLCFCFTSNQRKLIRRIVTKFLKLLKLSKQPAQWIT